MLSKAAFTDVINNLQLQRIKEENFSNDMEKIFDVALICTFTECLSKACLRILEEAMDDEPHQWIEYYIYETDFGKRDLECTLDNKPIKLRNVNDLYDLLTNKRK